MLQRQQQLLHTALPHLSDDGGQQNEAQRQQDGGHALADRA